ncbi:KDO2-lipid IV(A) lauroyltransferase [Melghirimyces profundicolus]|uniref:KDO2-lipid IV(A) lauroyltransferase n=1 Tax=Melghirimyces profundicolus TaxID=1242148 RepID=A0A2T6C7W1_9BACL|nr:lysophospholipid acyltransferase family protein [Melghirimyces profundicolus]PTX64373.1 KDO2-lipid IV(A) lauroyltransferase [Melghirimyces profundicolus]
MYDWLARVTAGEGSLGKWSRRLETIPESMALPLFQSAGWVLYGYDRDLRERVRKNLGEWGPSRRFAKQISRRYFTHLAVLLYELLCADKFLNRTGDERIAISGEHHLKETLQRGKGAILFAPHTGNFFYCYWYLSRLYPCLTVATAGSAELRPLYLRFRNMGCEGLDYDQTPPITLMKRLRNHLKQNGVVFLLGDFWRPTFQPSRLFGKPTRSPSGTAVLSIEGEIPVIPCLGTRTRDYRHQLTLYPPLHLYRRYDRTRIREAVNHLNIQLEQMIREQPEQWLYWFDVHHRWEDSADNNGTGRESR